MPYIALPPDIPGIGSAFAFSPDTANLMLTLAHMLLFEPGEGASLTARDRELIASFVSCRNNCFFCETSHRAAAAAHPGGSPELVDAICSDPDTAAIPDKLKALLAIAGLVQEDGRSVTPAMVRRAHEHGASDLEIHDTVLIAAMVSMYNRYVDGLGAWRRGDDELYREIGEKIADEGYVVAGQRTRQT